MSEERHPSARTAGTAQEARTTSDAGPSRHPADPEAVCRRVAVRCREIERRQVERALRRCESQGGLTPEQRGTVRELADAIVARLLSAPANSLRAAERADDPDAVRAVARLFDPGAPGDDDGGSGSGDDGT